MPTTRSRLGVIFLTVFIDLVGFGLIVPILPFYAQSMGVAGLGFGALIGAFSLAQFLATVVLGRLSDRVGRRPVILASILLGAVGYTAFAFARVYWLLLGARLVAGFAAGNLSVAQAYIADVTSPADRSRGMGLVGAAFGLGFIVGPALGGVAGHYGGPEAVGLLAAGLCLVNFTSAYFILGESLKVEHRVTRRLLDTEHIRAGLRQPRIRPAFLVFALVPLAFSGYMVALPLYAGATFGWAERELGLYFTVIGAVAAFVQGYFFGKLSRHVSDRRLAMAGVFGMALAIAALPLVRHGTTLYTWGFVLAFANSIGAPALTGIISSLAGTTEQGAMLGAAQSLSALGRFSGPFLFGEIYDRIGHAQAFFAAAAFMGVAWLFATRIPGPSEDDGKSAASPTPTAGPEE
ncbi:MAG: MFS transporter [Gemmatimonadales bacterium]|nr:MFS transporter [Gemmatimonadales bacterium]